MSADRLRRVSAEMREYAEAATPGPWEFDPDEMDPGVWSDHGASGTWVVSEWGTYENDARHIAAWSPPVALAVAVWLNHLALLDARTADGVPLAGWSNALALCDAWEAGR